MHKRCARDDGNTLGEQVFEMRRHAVDACVAGQVPGSRRSPGRRVRAGPPVDVTTAKAGRPVDATTVVPGPDPDPWHQSSHVGAGTTRLQSAMHVRQFEFRPGGPPDLLAGDAGGQCLVDGALVQRAQDVGLRPHQRERVAEMGVEAGAQVGFAHPLRPRLRAGAAGAG